MVFNSMTENEIIEGCLKGDRRAQNEMYKLYYPLMSSVARRYFTNTDDARNAVNQGFLKVLTKLDQFSRQHKLSTWIRSVLVNSIIDELRRTKRYREGVHLDPDLLMNEASGRSLVEHEWESERLLNMLLRLPELSRNVFNLYVIDGYSHKEAADKLGIAETASRWHLSVARKKLREMMEQELNAQKKTTEEIKQKLKA